jgi:hypothetical protein
MTMGDWGLGIYRTTVAMQFLKGLSMGNQEIRVKTQELIASLERHILRLQKIPDKNEEIQACKDAVDRLKVLLRED